MQKYTRRSLVLHFRLTIYKSLLNADDKKRFAFYKSPWTREAEKIPVIGSV